MTQVATSTPRIRRSGRTVTSTRSVVSRPLSMRTSSTNAVPPLYSCLRCRLSSFHRRHDILITMRWRRTDLGRDVQPLVFQQHRHQRQSVVEHCPYRRVASQGGVVVVVGCHSRPLSRRRACPQSPHRTPRLRPPTCLTHKSPQERYPMLVMVTIAVVISRSSKTLPMISIKKPITVPVTMRMECSLSLMRHLMQHLQQRQLKRRLGLKRKVRRNFLIQLQVKKNL
ncbi:uncharacterized protein LOC124534605 [Vanessa cardui]|uniref:uncharacterized protein LOC124534605 n=1 Tax=Vanessa cardui TaxID=171605 RepID=UPI001F1418E8|nr:uncharacterized protein LOC124534605 [Vanessa cardui]